MSSHKIVIRRRENVTKLPDNVYAQSKRKIGSFFTSEGAIAIGLTPEEKAKYLPKILSISPNDFTFDREVRSWYANLTINVPTEGVTLEIGLDENDYPINLEQYVKYRFALIHPDVATSEEARKTTSNFRYYIFDAQADKKQAFDSLTARKDAMKALITLTADAKKVDMVLRLYGKNPATLDKEAKELYLDEQVVADPAGFTAKATDKNLENKAFTEQLVTAQILRKVGNAYFDGDDKLADNLEDLLLFYKDAKNSGTLSTLKARLQGLS